MPKLSYLVSSYNAERFITAHLSDLLNGQTDPDFEVIVVVPESSGNDSDFAHMFASRDTRVKVIDTGYYQTYGESWLTAWEFATGDFVVNSNTDDFHAPRFTEVFHREMSAAISRTGPPVAFGYAGITVRDESGRITGRGYRPPFNKTLFSRECHCGPQVCWRNDERFRNHLNWGLMTMRANEHTSAFDYWLWLYFMSLGYSGHTINELLTIYTQRQDSIENRDKHWNNYETFSAISEFFPHHVGTSLKGVDEFKDFSKRPQKEEWVKHAKTGKPWPPQ